MGVKSKSADKESSNEMTFPCIGGCIDNGPIVLFNAHGEGMVIDPRAGAHVMAEVGEDWHMPDFTIYHGTVTLEND